MDPLQLYAQLSGLLRESMELRHAWIGGAPFRANKCLSVSTQRTLRLGNATPRAPCTP